MKYFLSIAAMFLMVCSSYGQYTFHSTKYEDMDLDTDESETYTYHQIFSISLPDKYLIHTVLDDTGTKVTDSQLYRIIDVQEEDHDGELWKIITVKSGVSGNKYVYVLEFKGDTPIFAFKKSETRYLNYIGKLTTFKTYLQDDED
jgi:hypothetical protein